MDRLAGIDHEKTRATLVRDEGRAGTSTGVNIRPGHDDDGWIVPLPVRLSDGSQVQLFKDGEALHGAYEAIRMARRRICLEVYIFASDNTGRAFADLLCHKARQGLEVYVIYDSFGSLATDGGMFEQMQRAGVHVQAFHPIWPWDVRFGWRPFNRNHRKLLVIDDNIAGLGGLNIGAEYAGSWVVRLEAKQGDAWRDNAISIVGPAARVFLRSFINTWRYVCSGGRLARMFLMHNPMMHERGPARAVADGGAGELGVIASVPTLHAPLAIFFENLLRQAQHSIDLTMAYFAPANDLIAALIGAAGRGVKVRLMLPQICDVPILLTAARSFYERLMTAGVQIYERKNVVLHAKTLNVDRRISVIGSANLDYRSIEYNCELSAMIHSEELGQQMHDLFEHDVGYADRICLEQWRKRPWRDRMHQWMVNRTRYLL